PPARRPPATPRGAPPAPDAVAGGGEAAGTSACGWMCDGLPSFPKGASARQQPASGEEEPDDARSRRYLCRRGPTTTASVDGYARWESPRTLKAAEGWSASGGLRCPGRPSAEGRRG